MTVCGVFLPVSMKLIRVVLTTVWPFPTSCLLARVHAHLQSLEAWCLKQHLGHCLRAGTTHVCNDAVELLCLQVAVEALNQLVHNLQ